MALPLSWHDAKPLLANMDGPVAPDDWQGGLPIKYHLGGKRVRVHVKIEMDNSTQPYYVVEGRIRGAQLPDEWIVLGNHRDAWVFGGVDPQQRYRIDDGTDPRAGKVGQGQARVRGAPSSSAVGTEKRSASPVPPSGESSSPMSCAKKPSPISTSMRPRPDRIFTARPLRR